MEWLILLYTGRLSRTNYIISICFLIFVWLLVIGLNVYLPLLSGLNEIPPFFRPITIGIMVLIQFFAFSLHARRFHDLGRSGWLSLLFFIPLVNIVVLLFLLFSPGDEKENKYGIPQASGSYDLVAVFLPKQHHNEQPEQKTEMPQPPPSTNPNN